MRYTFNFVLNKVKQTRYSYEYDMCLYKDSVLFGKSSQQISHLEGHKSKTGNKAPQETMDHIIGTDCHDIVLLLLTILGTHLLDNTTLICEGNTPKPLSYMALNN